MKKTIFQCSHCDAQYPKWQGQCHECGQWGTISQEFSNAKTETSVKPGKPSLLEVSVEEHRIATGITECDRVLGGGIIPGSLILLGGDPGVGKSTLALQIALHVASDQVNVLYVSGEESASQIGLRLHRLEKSDATEQREVHASSKSELSNKQTKSLQQTASKKIGFLGETCVEVIIETLKQEKPTLVIIDSVQTLTSLDVPQEAGSITQIKACTTKLLEAAKKYTIAIILIGHVTKEGLVAGPKSLEHLVDVVVYLEGENTFAYRLLRSVKNRFGATNEVGVFDMSDHGLTEVANPSEFFLSEHHIHAPGSVITSVIEGSRAFLVEVQALVTKTVFGYPQRKASGFDVNRLQLLLAVLQERARINFQMYDVHVNIVGGLKIKDPSVDLAVCLAAISALKKQALDPKLVALGEIGLSGEVRKVIKLSERLKEAERMGLRSAVIPKIKTQVRTRLSVHEVTHIAEALSLLSPSSAAVRSQEFQPVSSELGGKYRNPKSQALRSL